MTQSLEKTEGTVDRPTPQGVDSGRPPLILEAGRADRQYWFDLWRYRELLFVLAWRDVSVHYKQTAVGIVWAVVRPLLTILVFTVVFSRIAGLTGDGVPYILLVACGMLPWQLFAACLNESSNSLVANSNLVSKVYFPRLLVPLSSLAVAMIDFLVCLPLLAILCVFYSIWPTWHLLVLPLFVALALAAAIGSGLWLCALNVKYRDVRYVLPFIVQFGLYLSPVGYSSERVPENFRWLYDLNPMAGVIDGFRWSVLGVGRNPFESPSFFASVALVAMVTYFGIRYFRATEKTFADVI